jgi:preprotein translocase subunit YajC
VKKRVALTTIELIALVGIVVIIIIFVISIMSRLQSGKNAEEDMRNYVSNLYPGREIIGVSCVKVDSDGDGYVSCTATVDLDNGPNVQEKMVAAECAGGFANFNEGCRPMKMTVPLNQ